MQTLVKLALAALLVVALAPTADAGSLSGCGTGATHTPSANFGAIDTGTGTVMTCVLTFGAALPAAPICVISVNGLVSSRVATTTTTITVQVSASLPSSRIFYVCDRPIT